MQIISAIQLKGPIMARKYQRHGNCFKLKVALEAIKEQKTMAELIHEFGLSQSQIHAWKKELLGGGDKVFGEKSKKNHEKEVDNLHKVIGKLKAENDFLEHALKS